MTRLAVVVQCGDPECCRTIRAALSAWAVNVEAPPSCGPWLWVTDRPETYDAAVLPTQIVGLAARRPPLLPETVVYHSLSLPMRLSALCVLIADAVPVSPETVPLYPGGGVRLARAGRTLIDAEGASCAQLTEKEMRLLEALIRAEGRPCASEALLADVWAYQPGVPTHTLQTHVSRLRAHLQACPEPLDIVLSEEGYRLATG